MARGARQEPPNTLAGIDVALAAGARRVEIDVCFLSDADCALYHDCWLTDGRIVRHLPAAEAAVVGLLMLSQAVRRVAASGALLQIDLKEEGLLSGDEVQWLL